MHQILWEVLSDYIDSKLSDYKRLLPQEAIDGPSELILLSSMPLSQLTVVNDQQHTLTADQFETIFLITSSMPQINF